MQIVGQTQQLPLWRALEDQTRCAPSHSPRAEAVAAKVSVESEREREREQPEQPEPERESTRPAHMQDAVGDAARRLRAFESAGSALNATHRAELSRQRASVAFNDRSIELEQTFRTAPDPRAALELPSPRASRSGRGARAVSGSFVSAEALLRAAEFSAASNSDSEASSSPSAATATTLEGEARASPKKKAKKSVSFKRTVAEEAADAASATQTYCCHDQLTPALTGSEQSVAEMASPIHAACQKGDYLVLKHLLSFYFGADGVKLVNSRCACGRTPLEVACEAGDARIVKLLLRRHADPNNGVSTAPMSTSTSSSTRHMSSRGHSKRSLMRLGSTTSSHLSRKRHQRSCLSVACRARNIEILKLLLQYGARVDEEALVLAASHGHEDVVRVLVAHATADAKKKSNPVHQLFQKKDAASTDAAEMPLISSSSLQKACSAAASTDHSQLIRVLLGDGKTAASRKSVVRCAFDAVGLPDYRLLRCLSKLYPASVLVDARDKSSNASLLHAAVKSGSAKSALLLVKLGADVSARDSSGIPPLYLACARGQEAVVRTLLKAGATCSAVGPSGETPLHLAAQENQLACVKLLLETGKAPVDDVTQDNCTALHLASQRGNTEVAACLLDHGANVDAVTVGNESPLLKASRMSQFQTVKLLLSRNASTQPVASTSGSARASEEKMVVASAVGEPSASVASPQLPRSRSWTGRSSGSEPRTRGRSGERVFIAKSNTHTSLRHWIRTVLKN